jgi:hypothetical protein
MHRTTMIAIAAKRCIIPRLEGNKPADGRDPMVGTLAGEGAVRTL